MTRDPRYDILFEPVRIGPVTAKNRFYQVPHCNGMGFTLPRTAAHMRGMKAEGGWAVVNTEYCSIHVTSDDLPYPYATLWDDDDIGFHALMVEQVHGHGALAGCELWYGGRRTLGQHSREAPFGTTSLPVSFYDPVQTRSMDKEDIREFRRWHREAAKRARQAGFDIVYVYATHGYLLHQFLSRSDNQRSDEYGGSLENRVRLVREIIEETKEAVGEACGIAVRFCADDGGDGGDGVVDHGEQREMFAILAELPDLWDINITDYTLEAGASRFVKEAAQEDYVAFVKTMTTKPVVGVGRFTSPDTMARQIREGRLDMIGAARPSIADPFLPKKIEEGRVDDIRECIGCNICISGDRRGLPIQCTQNPTMGEEWRRGWHPERIAPKGSDAKVLVVGAGPAGLEAARALGQRGYRVALAEAARELGGRVAAESQLPGLAEWLRVRDYRVHQIGKMPNVEVYRESALTEADILEFGSDHVVIATGARWRGDGVGRWHRRPVAGHDLARVLTPDDIMAGATVAGPAVVFDDDHFYIGGLVAEKLMTDGLDVTLVTPAGEISKWSEHTLELERVHARLLGMGMAALTGTVVTGFDGEGVDLTCVYTGRTSRRAAASLVMVTARIPNDELYHALKTDALAAAGVKSVTRIGDCLAPGTIAAAVFSAHRFARELDCPHPGDVPFKRERAAA